MAKRFPKLEDQHIDFIRAQHLFFVGTAAPIGRVNISPKGMDSLKVLSPRRIIWANMTGSGNETAGHLKQANRMTLMWCSFDKKPLILRVYSTARTIHHDHEDWDALSAEFPDLAAKRQVYDMNIEMVQTSCGFAVPIMDFQSERSTLQDYFEQSRGTAAEDYWSGVNAKTIDGLLTGTPEGNSGERG